MIVDPATASSDGKWHRDYTKFLVEDGLRGARIGVARKMFRLTPRADRVMKGPGRDETGRRVLVDPPISSKSLAIRNIS